MQYDCPSIRKSYLKYSDSPACIHISGVPTPVFRWTQYERWSQGTVILSNIHHIHNLTDRTICLVNIIPTVHTKAAGGPKARVSTATRKTDKRGLFFFLKRNQYHA